MTLCCTRQLCVSSSRFIIFHWFISSSPSLCFVPLQPDRCADRRQFPSGFETREDHDENQSEVQTVPRQGRSRLDQDKITQNPAARADQSTLYNNPIFRRRCRSGLTSTVPAFHNFCKTPTTSSCSFSLRLIPRRPSARLLDIERFAVLTIVLYRSVYHHRYPTPR